jgi:glycosyltransferase involved in cell wall biosynthesis
VGPAVSSVNIKEIVQAIAYFFTHPDEAPQRGEGNRRRAVLARYNWEKESKAFLRL